MKYIIAILLLPLVLVSCKKDVKEGETSKSKSESLWQIMDEAAKQCPPLGLTVDLIEFENGEVGYTVGCNSHIADCAVFVYDKNGVLMEEPYRDNKIVKTIFNCR